jgi:soluble lytic murein transglycosylase
VHSFIGSYKVNGLIETVWSAKLRNSLTLLALSIALAFSADARAGSTDRLSKAFGAGLGLLDRDPAKSAAVFRDLQPDVDPIADYVAYFYALSLARSGAQEDARKAFRDVLLRWPGSPVAPRAAASLAPLLLAAGDEDAVLALAEQYARGSHGGPDAAAVALVAGQALVDSDQPRAAAWLMRARQVAPGSRAGTDAASLLSDLRRATPSLRPTTADALLEEAKLAAREGDRATQREMLDRLLLRYPALTEAALLRAKVVAAEKGKLEAAAWLDERLPRATSKIAEAQILYAAATYRWNADDADAARDGFVGAITRAPASGEAQQSHYSLGRIAESQGRYAGAASEYGAASLGPIAEVTRESLWRTGWAAYLATDYATAGVRFSETAERALADGTAREQALYWQARSEERAGDRAGADQVYRALVTEFPDGFYALMVEQRLGLTAPPPQPLEINAAETSQYPELFVTLDRARILESAGLHDFAAQELKNARSTTDTGAARALLPELVRMGAPEQALRTALSLYRSGALQEAELYPYLYPHAFAPIVESEARSRRLDPFLVYSLIRQESAFDRHAVSPAAAYGLMQLLVPTARRMAASEPALARVGPEDLFRPEVNIRLGTAYLATLAGRFENNPVLMLAGYNAGEQAAERWRTKLSGLERDEFIEQISYRETRDYVKKVLRNYRNYRRLYDRGGAAVDERLEQPPR